MRVLVVTNLYPTERRPALGPFVRDQVEALRAIDGIELELHSFDPPGGIRPYLAESIRLMRKFRGSDYDVVHAHYGLTGFCALAVRGAGERVVTFHGDDLRLPKVAPISRLTARLSDLPATVSAGLARSEADGLGGPGTRRRVAMLPCGIDLDRLKPVARYRNAADTAPTADSLAFSEGDVLDTDPLGASAAGMPNVLAEDTWDLFRILLR